MAAVSFRNWRHKQGLYAPNSKWQNGEASNIKCRSALTVCDIHIPFLFWRTYINHCRKNKLNLQRHGIPKIYTNYRKRTRAKYGPFSFSHLTNDFFAINSLKNKNWEEAILFYTLTGPYVASCCWCKLLFSLSPPFCFWFVSSLFLLVVPRKCLFCQPPMLYSSKFLSTEISRIYYVLVSHSNKVLLLLLLLLAKPGDKYIIPKHPLHQDPW